MGEFFGNLVLGISLAAPIGPASVAIIQAGLAGGFRRAFLTGVGVTLADTTYLLVAFFGLSGLISGNLVRGLVLAAGAVVLGFLGVRSIQAAGAQLRSEPESVSERSPLVVGYLVNISNPLAIVWWVGIFGAMLGATSADGTRLSALLNSSAILLGILIWHSTTSTLTHWGKRILNERVTRWISIVAGLVLILFGVRFAIQAVQLLATQAR